MTGLKACWAVTFGLLIAGAQAQTTTGTVDSATTTPPNIVIIFTDDMGYGDLSCYGQKEYKTPHLDKMADEGLKLTQFYVTVAACSPSRASLLTGQYPMRTGVVNVFGPEEMKGLHPKAPLLPKVLKEKGYATALIGKWHLGFTPDFVPEEKGFDYFYGLPYSNDMEPCPLIRGTEIIESPANQETLTRRYTEEALKFIDANAAKEQPFFLYYAQTFPHVPLHVSDKFKGSSGAGLYGDVITEIDWSVGEVLRNLREKGLAENTLVIFTSDNGPWAIKGDHAGTAGELRGSKGMDFEGGVRVPFIAWWPNTLPAGKVIDIPAITTDLMPTITKLAGGVLPTAKYDGKDIWPVLAEGKNVGERTLHFVDYYYKNQVGAIRKGDWKLLTAREKMGNWDARTTELINLKEDPNESNNLAEQHPEIVAQLTREADQMREELRASNPWDKGIDRKSKEALKYVMKEPVEEASQARPETPTKVRYGMPSMVPNRSKAGNTSTTDQSGNGEKAQPQQSPDTAGKSSKRYPIIISTPIPDLSAGTRN